MPSSKTLSLPDYIVEALKSMRNKGISQSEIVALGVEWVLQQLEKKRESGVDPILEIKRELQKHPSQRYKKVIEKKKEGIKGVTGAAGPSYDE